MSPTQTEYLAGLPARLDRQIRRSLDTLHFQYTSTIASILPGRRESPLKPRRRIDSTESTSAKRFGRHWNFQVRPGSKDRSAWINPRAIPMDSCSLFLLKLVNVCFQMGPTNGRNNFSLRHLMRSTADRGTHGCITWHRPSPRARLARIGPRCTHPLSSSDESRGLVDVTGQPIASASSPPVRPALPP